MESSPPPESGGCGSDGSDSRDVAPHDDGVTERTFGDAVAHSLRWMMLGLAAGGWSGLLVGGALGRAAMFVLRLTSPDSVRGLTSDDGFEIGRITGETAFLLGATTFLGGVAGVAYVCVRAALPPRWAVAVWTVVGGSFGGMVILHADGVDFRVLQPHWLAVSMFIVIPTAGAALMAVLVERWSARWWWVNARRTAVACAPAIVNVALVVPFVIAIAAMLCYSAITLSSKVTKVVHAVGPAAVTLSLLALATWSTWALTRDVGAIL